MHAMHSSILMPFVENDETSWLIGDIIVDGNNVINLHCPLSTAQEKNTCTLYHLNMCHTEYGVRWKTY